MTDARTVLLGDVVQIVSGFAFPSDRFGEVGDLPVVRIRDVVPGYSQTYYRGDYQVKYLVADGDLLVGMDGEFNCGTWTGGPALLNQRVCKVVARPDAADQGYLRHLLPKTLKSIEARTPQSTVKHLSVRQIEAIAVTLPPLPDQRRIAALLGKADAIRRKRQQAIRLTDDLLRSAFLDMFGDPVTNPKGWPTQPIADVADVITGNTPPRERPEYYGDAIEWIKSDNINTRSHILTRAVEGLSEAGRALGRAAPEGSTLMTCIAGSRSCIGNVALTDRAVALNQQINAIVPGPSVDANFLYVQLLLAKPLIQAASTDSMKGMVSKGRLSSVLLPAPAEERQRAFGRWFSGFLHWRSRLDAGCGATDDLFHALAQRAFRGAGA